MKYTDWLVLKILLMLALEKILQNSWKLTKKEKMKMKITIMKIMMFYWKTLSESLKDNLEQPPYIVQMIEVSRILLQLILIWLKTNIRFLSFVTMYYVYIFLYRKNIDYSTENRFLSSIIYRTWKIELCRSFKSIIKCAIWIKFCLYNCHGCYN